ncbi:PorV/PorQ family protein [bacterium]|nr:PorV/PorQ family protein [bacterium]
MKWYRWLVMLLTGLIFSVQSVFGADTERAGFDVLNWECGARSAAMGGAVVGMRGNLQFIGYNPAALVSINGETATFGYERRFVDSKSGYLAYARQFIGLHLAASVRYADYGKMTRMDVNQTDLGSFSPADIVCGITVADSLSMGLAWGITAKFIALTNYDIYSASAIAADIGVQYSLYSQSLTFGASICHIGTALNAFIDHKELLPTTMRLGATKQLAHLPLIFNLNFIRYVDHKSDQMGGFYWSIGGEFTLSESLRFRFGYHSRGREQGVVEGLSRMAGISFGLGVKLLRYQVDVGYGLYGALGSLPSVSLGYKF